MAALAVRSMLKPGTGGASDVRIGSVDELWSGTSAFDASDESVREVPQQSRRPRGRAPDRGAAEPTSLNVLVGRRITARVYATLRLCD